MKKKCCFSFCCFLDNQPGVRKWQQHALGCLILWTSIFPYNWRFEWFTWEIRKSSSLFTENQATIGWKQQLMYRIARLSLLLHFLAKATLNEPILNGKFCKFCSRSKVRVVKPFWEPVTWVKRNLSCFFSTIVQGLSLSESKIGPRTATIPTLFPSLIGNVVRLFIHLFILWFRVPLIGV